MIMLMEKCIINKVDNVNQLLNFLKRNYGKNKSKSIKIKSL